MIIGPTARKQFSEALALACQPGDMQIDNFPDWGITYRVAADGYEPVPIRTRYQLTAEKHGPRAAAMSGIPEGTTARLETHVRGRGWVQLTELTVRIETPDDVELE
jgi:hypothetical protein